MLPSLVILQCSFVHGAHRPLCLLLSRYTNPSCLANQNVSTFHVSRGDAHSRSKFRRTCGTSLPISMMEMFLPMQVREPYPN